LGDDRLDNGSAGENNLDSLGMSLSRIVSFSDGVFAVAITLLVLSIKVPVLRPEVADRELPRALLHLSPIFTAYVISFLVVGLFWIGHHRVFGLFKRYDRGLLWLNLIFLMTIVFVPFPTSLISKYSDSRAALIVYAVSIAVSGLLLCLIMWYGVHDRRLVDFVDENEHLRFMFGYSSMALIFLLSIAVSFLNVDAAKYFWLVMIPSNFLIDHWLLVKLEERRGGRREGAA